MKTKSGTKAEKQGKAAHGGETGTVDTSNHETLEPPRYDSGPGFPGWGDTWALFDARGFVWPRLGNYNCLKPAVLHAAEQALRSGLVIGTHANPMEAVALAAEIACRAAPITARYDTEGDVLYIKTRPAVSVAVPPKKAGSQ